MLRRLLVRSRFGLVPFAALTAAPLAISCAAHADSSTPAAHVDRAAYQKALSDGRSLAKAGKSQEAVAAFQRALAASPDDPTALSELSVAALKAKDYDVAESSARKAAEKSPTPALRGASYYNLGRVLEEKGDKAGAIDAYAASLRERENATVRARLAALQGGSGGAEAGTRNNGAAAGGAADPFAPQKMAGPFKSVTEFCDKVARPACENDLTCNTHPVASAAKVSGPWLAAQVFSTDCIFDTENKYGRTDYHLGVRTAAGWYFAPSRFIESNSSHCEEKRHVGPVRVEDVQPGGAPEVTVRSKSTGDCSGPQEQEDWNREEEVIAGIGPSGTPSATPTLRLKDNTSSGTLDANGNIGNVTHSTVDLKATFGADGKLDVTGDASGLDPKQRAGAVGKHAVVFP